MAWIEFRNHWERRAAMGAIGAALGVMVLPAWWRRMGRVGEPASGRQALPLDAYAVYCTPAPDAAKVDDSVVADQTFRLTVPLETPVVPVRAQAQTQHIRQGQVVSFLVESPRDGALAVHGLSELVLAPANATAVVRFRAIYSGRFGLHFHGADGSHFEIAALEILSS